jgi:hypothetical protein
MSKYICPNCNYDFKQKSHYIRHVENKKKPCKIKEKIQQSTILHNTTDIRTEIAEFPQKNAIFDNIINNIDVKDNDIVCVNCKKTFTRSDTLIRHLKLYCKKKKEENKKEELIVELQKKDEIIKILQDENNLLKNKFTEYDQKLNELTNKKNKKSVNIVNNTNNTNNTNTNTNSNNTINIIKIDFGKEKLSNIDNNVFYNSINNGSGASIPAKIIEGIHFDPNNKQYNTVCITDIARNIAQVYKQKNWCVTDANELVDNLFDKAVVFIDNKKEELEDEINKKSDPIKKKINKELKLINLMANPIDAYDMDDYGNRIDNDGNIVDISSIKRGERLKIKAKDNIKLSLYNNRKIVKK